MKQRIGVLRIVFGIALSIIPVRVYGAEREELVGQRQEALALETVPEEEVSPRGNTAQVTDFMLVSANAGLNNYTGNWSRLVHSYLQEDSDGRYVRVQYAGGYVYIERYQKDFTLYSNQKLQEELPKFGGFHDDGSSYYLVFAQDNKKEEDNCEVLRVVKYSHDWQRLGAASVYGANTRTPFLAGCLRMDSRNGALYLRLGREMYLSEDGYHHQSCMTVKIRTSDMTVADIASAVQNNSAGYVSHSFNQFIRVEEDGRLIALDHGDAYPRSAVLSKYAGDELGISGTVSTIDTLAYAGTIGQNYTDATLGGLEISNSAYLTVGSSGPQDGTDGGRVRNIYLTATPRNIFTKDATRFTWITNYTGNTPVCSNPQLVEISKERYLLLWTETDYNNQENLRYVFLSGSGGLMSEIYTAAGQLSDCQPIYDGSRTVWYVADGKNLTFYTVDDSGRLNRRTAQSPAMFEDIPVDQGYWKFVSTRYVGQRGIMGGVGGTRLFLPDSQLTRAMFATVLYRMAGEPAVSYSTKFADVEEGKWYSNGILWAYQQGLVSGYQDGRYGPNDNITREQIAKMLYLYGSTQGYDVSGTTSLEKFTDADSVSPWAVGYMQWAVDTGMIGGKPNEGGGYRLDPRGEATRAECAKMLMMFLES
ncbi:MAG: S-layer homology domain-containing protein, partial [Lachnospiraceae bacterium]|nr:S-layer homology domain-containing protein [Lachnospiraceae bacterium]